VTGGELILLVKSKRADVCYEVSKKVLQALGPHNVASSDYTQGFGYMGQPPYGGRDLTGYRPLRFIPGERNSLMEGTIGSWTGRGIRTTCFEPSRIRW
jgi:hypothetical protein